MIIIVGLGNPGKNYQRTRHNVGFQVTDEFVKKNGCPNFKLSKKFKALVSEGFLDKKRIIVAKPQTFMNLSGKSVKALITRRPGRVETEGLWVIHDDIDLPLGKIRISKGRGAAGHKGVESIIKELRTKNFVRFRIGIQPKAGKPRNPEKFVLQKFNRKEEKIVKEIIKKTVEVIEFSLKAGLEKAMSKYNT